MKIYDPYSMFERTKNQQKKLISSNSYSNISNIGGKVLKFNKKPNRNITPRSERNNDDIKFVTSSNFNESKKKNDKNLISYPNRVADKVRITFFGIYSF